jgi:hypothetical protein
MRFIKWDPFRDVETLQNRINECSRIPSGVPGIRMMKRIYVPGDRRSTFTKPKTELYYLHTDPQTRRRTAKADYGKI